VILHEILGFWTKYTEISETWDCKRKGDLGSKERFLGRLLKGENWEVSRIPATSVFSKRLSLFNPDSDSLVASLWNCLFLRRSWTKTMSKVWVLFGIDSIERVVGVLFFIPVGTKPWCEFLSGT
jgi:hypothetical protein